MKRFLKLLATLTLSVVPLLAANAPQTSQKESKPLVFELKATGEKPLHIQHTDNGLVVKEYPGQVILINFWGKHCRWCMKEIPHLVKLQKAYKGKLQIIAIHAQQAMTPGERLRLSQRFGFNYPIYEYQDNPEFVQYLSYRTSWEGGLPFSVVFDAKGSYVYSFPGYAPMEDLKRVIEFAIKHPGGK